MQTLAFDHLDAPVVAPNRITPAPELEGDFFPQPSWIVDAIHERIVPLPGHVSASTRPRARSRNAHGSVCESPDGQLSTRNPGGPDRGWRVAETGDLAHTPHLLVASRVAWMHYVEDLTNLEIAARLGISRFRVARLLERALKSGIVQITIRLLSRSTRS